MCDGFASSAGPTQCLYLSRNPIHVPHYRPVSIELAAKPLVGPQPDLPLRRVAKVNRFVLDGSDDHQLVRQFLQWLAILDLSITVCALSLSLFSAMFRHRRIPSAGR